MDVLQKVIGKGSTLDKFLQWRDIDDRHGDRCGVFWAECVLSRRSGLVLQSIYRHGDFGMASVLCDDAHAVAGATCDGPTYWWAIRSTDWTDTNAHAEARTLV